MADLEQRVSDSERETVAERLRTAAAEGRLDADELEERLGAAYAARTVGDLQPLTADLPAAVPAPAPPPARTPVMQSHHVRRKLATFLTVNVICLAVWLATGAEGSFWPGWVLLGTGVALFSAWVRALLGVEEREEAEERQAELRSNV